ncbi:translation initiation factor IF-2 N-terminal domain-containing protein [Corynebacterium casei]|uniref:translation initiation factor IF-2 N-terminal domain-containing protein n=2 Tax=Corynebacterium casei TaxID=160386 RepID=UPI003F905E6F
MATADEQLKEQLSGAAALAAQIDKEKLGDKVRVYSLAKQLGISSKLLIEQLHLQGISKRAQSALSAEEVGKVFDSLPGKESAPASAEAESAAAAEAEAETEAPAPKARKAAKKASKVTKKTATKATKSTQKKTTSKSAAKSEAPEAPVEVKDDAAAPAVEETSADAPQAEEAPQKKTRKRAVKKNTRKQTKKAAESTPIETAPAAEETPVDDAAVQAAVEAEAQAAVAEAAAAPVAEETLQTETRKRSKTRRVVKRSAGTPEAPATESPVAETTAADNESGAESGDDSDKLRYRVQKNVENEILQIEGKVESELAAVALEALAEKNHDGDDSEDSDEHDIQIDDSFVESLLTPPAPKKTEEDDVLAAYAPIFMPPQPASASNAAVKDASSDGDSADSHDDNAADGSSARRRRGHRGTSRGRGKDTTTSANAANPEKPEVEIIDEPRGIKGSTRIESQRRRRAEMRSKDRENRHVVTQAEFLARREAVERTMVVRERERHDGPDTITQVGVLEDGMLVEHFVTDETNTSSIGNIYLGRVQNVLPSMEAAFIDIGTGRNGVLYAGEVNWRQAGLGGRSRKIEQAMKSGDQVLVQVAKDPVGHKGPRLTTQISLPGRFLVYVPGGRNAGISRKLPAPERKRLKEILEKVVPDQGGAIIRTAAENVAEEAIAADVNRLHDRWNDIQESAKKEKSSKGSDPVALYEEPQMLVKVVRDLFNEDFDRLVVDGERPFEVVSSYVNRLAPELADRVFKYDRSENGGVDAFETYRIDEQLQKALSRKVWLPSGGTLVIDRTEAMTVVDVNTGKFTGTGGNLEETVTKNNLEAAEEVVRQMRLRDLGGMIVVDFIDMVLPENQELVLRRLKEALGRDRTRHQVSEVTSLGLVQMTRKRLGSGLLETFSTECEACQGRGLILHEDPVEEGPFEAQPHDHRHDHRGDSRDNRGDQRRGHKNARDNARDNNQHDKHDNEPDDQHDQGDSHGEHEDSNAHTSERGSRRGQSRRSATKRAGRRGPSTRNEPRRNDSRRSGSSNDDSSLEDLIAGIVVDSSNVKNEDSRDDHRDAQRRAQRRSQRGSQRDAQRDSKQETQHEDSGSGVRGVSDIESIAFAASDRAEALDEVGEFSSYVSEDKDSSADLSVKQGGKSYDEAVKEFEASPRRKRKTRGNSRSDHAPRPQDFDDAVAISKSSTDSDSDGDARSAKGSQDDAPAKEIKRDSKRRRVRATNRRQDTEQRPVNVGNGATEDSSTTERGAAKSASGQREDSARSEAKRAQVQAVTRGRRRAVRRVSQPRNPNQGAAAEKNAQAESREAANSGVETQRKRTESDVEVTTVRRGRKRAVRRVNPRAESQQETKQSGSGASEKKAAQRELQKNEQVSGQSSEQSTAQKSSGGRTRRRVARRGSK